MASRDVSEFPTGDETGFTYTNDEGTTGPSLFSGYITITTDDTTRDQTATTVGDTSSLNETRIDVQLRTQQKWGTAMLNVMTYGQVINALAARAGGEKKPPKKSQEEIERRNRNDLVRFLEDNRINSTHIAKWIAKSLTKNLGSTQ